MNASYSKLDGLEDILFRKSQEQQGSFKPDIFKPRKTNLIALRRNQEGIIQEGYSSSNRFRSERVIGETNGFSGLGNGWVSEKAMVEIPLFVSSHNVTKKFHSEDYTHLPDDLKEILNQGLLKTSGERKTDYSILMATTPDTHIPEGRTGTLLYRGEPVKVTICNKEFTIEIKGVGSPNGDNSEKTPMCREGYFGQSVKRYGHLNESEGIREFEHLELQRSGQISSFQEGESPRAIFLANYDTEIKNSNFNAEFGNLGYLIRLSPGNVRVSFTNNSAFPKSKNLERKLAVSIGRQYVELIGLEDCLLHSTIHPENIIESGEGYTLTDFSDCRRLSQIERPYDFLSAVLEKINEVPGMTKNGTSTFYQTIAEGLDVKWVEDSGYQGFIDAIWSQYFAQKVYNLREGRGCIVENEVKQYDIFRDQNSKITNIFIRPAIDFLNDEINMLKFVDGNKAKESLQIATERVEYLSEQLNDSTDINERFNHNQEFYLDLFKLPYMEK